MKTKHDTPKYGLIYHASLVGQASTKMKGKVSRMLAAKAALACRYGEIYFFSSKIWDVSKLNKIKHDYMSLLSFLDGKDQFNSKPSSTRNLFI